MSSLLNILLNMLIVLFFSFQMVKPSVFSSFFLLEEHSISWTSYIFDDGCLDDFFSYPSSPECLILTQCKVLQDHKGQQANKKAPHE